MKIAACCGCSVHEKCHKLWAKRDYPINPLNLCYRIIDIKKVFVAEEETSKMAKECREKMKQKDQIF